LFPAFEDGTAGANGFEVVFSVVVPKENDGGIVVPLRLELEGSAEVEPKV